MYSFVHYSIYTDVMLKNRNNIILQVNETDVFSMPHWIINIAADILESDDIDSWDNQQNISKRQYYEPLLHHALDLCGR